MSFYSAFFIIWAITYKRFGTRGIIYKSIGTQSDFSKADGEPKPHTLKMYSAGRPGRGISRDERAPPNFSRNKVVPEQTFPGTDPTE